MRRGQEQGAAGGWDAVSAPGRRTFLGVGIGCALPLIVGTGLGRAGGILPSSDNGAATDPVWDHIASEAWRTGREILGPLGARGEHVRRLAAQIDLFAAHLRGRGHEKRLDDEVRRLVRERGRESAAYELIDRYRELLQPGRHTARPIALDAGDMARCLDELVSRGITKSLTSRRASLERLASRLDRASTAATGRVVPAVAAGQKPGDDIGGYPDVPPGDFCEMLEFLVLCLTVLGAMMAMFGIAPAGTAAQELAALCEVLKFKFCGDKDD